MEKPKTDKSKLPVMILTHEDFNLCRQIQNILIPIGISFDGDGMVRACYSGLLLVRWNRSDERFLFHDVLDSKGRYIKEKPNALVFDARTQMQEILEHFTGSGTITPNMVVPGYLLSLIRSSPGDEMVAGFIRRDLGLAIPESVHKSGSDAILSWIMKNTAQICAVPARPSTHKLKLSYREDVSGSRNWSRTDTVIVEINVPSEVVNHAIDENDWSIAESWMAEHRGDGREIERLEGEENYTDRNDDLDYEFLEPSEEQPLLNDEMERLSDLEDED